MILRKLNQQFGFSRTEWKAFFQLLGFTWIWNFILKILSLGLILLFLRFAKIGDQPTLSQASQIWEDNKILFASLSLSVSLLFFLDSISGPLQDLYRNIKSVIFGCIQGFILGGFWILGSIFSGKVELIGFRPDWISLPPMFSMILLWTSLFLYQQRLPEGSKRIFFQWILTLTPLFIWFSLPARASFFFILVFLWIKNPKVRLGFLISFSVLFEIGFGFEIFGTPKRSLWAFEVLDPQWNPVLQNTPLQIILGLTTLFRFWINRKEIK